MNKIRNTDRDEEIRQKRKDGMGLKEIAEMYGFSIAKGMNKMLVEGKNGRNR